MSYLDNAATSPISSRVRALIADAVTEYGFNPSSPHPAGKKAKDALEQARLRISRQLGCEYDGVYFTSGATEAANILIQGFAGQSEENGSGRREIVLSEVEHPAVHQTVQSLGKKGWIPRVAKVDSEGRVAPEELAKHLNENTAMVCIMTVNNEVGSIQDIDALARLSKRVSKDIFFLTDAVQSIGKLPVSYDFAQVDAFFASGHKFGAPKGCGFFYLNPDLRIRPLLFGGGQERGYRPGTTDAASAFLLSIALEDRTKNIQNDLDHVSKLGDALLDGLSEKKIAFSRTISSSHCSPYILSLALAGTSAKEMVSNYAAHGICVSSGSACASRSSLRSRVLQALGLPAAQLDSTIRISFSAETAFAEVSHFVRVTELLLNVSPVSQREGAQYAVV